MKLDVKHPYFAKRLYLRALAAAIVLLSLCAMPAIASAACALNPNQQSCSGGYGVSEVFFGTGGQLCEPGVSGTSANYCAKSAVGETGVGNTASNSYQAQAGFNTNREPSLTLCVYKSSCGDNTTINLGTLNPGTTATTTAGFSVETYLASGYVVATASLPPQNGAYTMKTPPSAAVSDTTQEQFGINLCANTSPGTLSGVSSDPVCQTAGFCKLSALAIAANYNIPNEYYYPSGGSDTLATSSSSTGVTKFTISYIFNTTNVTPGGTYVFNQVIVATSTF